MRKKKKTVPALKDRKKTRKKPYCVDCLWLPKDVIMGMELGTLCGNREVSFRCLKGVQSVGKNRMVLQAKHHNIVINGTCLELSYYTLEEVKVCGVIESIIYETRG